MHGQHPVAIQGEATRPAPYNPHPVEVSPVEARVLRLEISRSLGHLQELQIAGQVGVQRQSQAFGSQLERTVDVRDHGERVNAGVRATGSVHEVVLAGQSVERLVEFALYRTLARLLILPPFEACTVKFN